MAILILALALLPAGLAEERDPPSAPARICRTTPERVVQPKREAETLRPQTLDRMPPAEVYYPVLRIVDGCEVPVKVRDYRR
jgi:hypothetical protein